MLGHEALLVDEDWPEADPELLIDDTVTVAVQVNGKLRATIELPLDTEEQTAEDQALAEPAVQRAMGERAARKIIVVRNRVVNIVV
jgi:leucyl-tRNA synthetase